MVEQDSRNVIRDLIGRSAPLSERLAGGFTPFDSAESFRLREELWKKWEETLSRDDPSALQRRLQWNGLPAATAKALLGEVTPSENSVPAWASIIRQVLESPLEEREDSFYQSFLRIARERLSTCAGARLGLLSENALAGLEQALQARLAVINERALDIEFSLHRVANPASVAPAETFARQCLLDGRYFRDYPVAARLSGLVIEFWVEAVSEFLQRLTDDAAILKDSFPHLVPSRISEIKAALSDPHRRGRSVFIVVFEDGFRLVYKPRSVTLEARWFQFGQWLNARGCPVEAKVLRVLDRGTHGWMEFVAPAPCASDREVELYFERAGGLLAMLYALAGSDMHFENLIAQGSYPVPVDLEVLMAAYRGNPSRDSADEALEEAQRTMRHSVLNIGMLPAWVNVDKGKAFNLGGLGANETSQLPGRSQAHRPRLGEQFISSHLYRGSILQGFRAMYGFLLEHREAILHPDGPLEPFRGATSRLVNRATSVYFRALRRATNPVMLAHGVTRSMEFEVFLKSVLHSPASVQGEVSSITTAEIMAMEQGDVPFFQGQVDSRDLSIPETGKTLTDFFLQDGFSIARQRFQRLSTNDLELQTKLISLSFDLMGDDEPAGEPKVYPFRSQNFRDEAIHLARAIQEEAIRSKEDVTWIAPQMIPGTDNFSLQMAGNSLYDGTLGVMIFLLAMEARLGDQTSGKLGRQVFASFRRSLRKSAYRAVLRQQSFGLSGLGGQIYALLAGARLSGESDMLAAATELGEIVNEETISRQKDLDLMGGLAGAIPPLLLLHSVTRDPKWLRKAIACGKRLIANQQETPEGHRSWKVFEKFLAGYSHGAAGFAASLMRLYQSSGEERFREAAQAGTAYEKTLFDIKEENWRDLRFENAFMSSWCHGAPGILLGRLLGGERETEDVCRALSATIRTGVSPVDQCCCGTAGKADILLSAAGALKDDSIRGEAVRLLEQSIARAQSVGGYRCYGKLPASVRGPGLFQGFAGIGYTLLRTEFPLPSVLGMEL